ncbi:hypothetical protein SAMN05444396_11133 [Flavobacterium segetis]|uniref:Uncharacterized protein n=1 Tax=Flavobacterium segetis TaxID=271157 RepID=A0A1M5JIU1_9FLAO|nr:hypothetical protein [Flavobacterium segetis]SHG40506.1 hypothetical protein SAMN05444396_11133 [Flavobacterium segetis]
MKTEKELNQEILETTTMIRNEYPELIKYLDELPLTIPIEDSPAINIKVLTDYSHSLKNIIVKYGIKHE